MIWPEAWRRRLSGNRRQPRRGGRGRRHLRRKSVSAQRVTSPCGSPERVLRSNSGGQPIPHTAPCSSALSKLWTLKQHLIQLIQLQPPLSGRVTTGEAQRSVRNKREAGMAPAGRRDGCVIVTGETSGTPVKKEDGFRSPPRCISASGASGCATEAGSSCKEIGRCDIGGERAWLSGGREMTERSLTGIVGRKDASDNEGEHAFTHTWPLMKVRPGCSHFSSHLRAT